VVCVWGGGGGEEDVGELTNRLEVSLIKVTTYLL
jgi:hypothetical protein